jgi:DNA-binding NarL/FixJ family response regulator
MRQNGRAAGGVLGYSVLVVDDFEPWRRRVCSELQKDNRWHVVGELTDGEAAVREARQRRPDAIVLDIGLGRMSGVGTARRILADNPTARVLFLTGHQSADVAETALETGARGYLLKIDAGGRLHLAMETVMLGGSYVSPSLPERVMDVPRRTVAESSHRAVFHTHEPELVNDYVRFAETALANGDVVVAIAGRDRLARIRERLTGRGVALDAAMRDGRYRVMETDTMVGPLTSSGNPTFEAVRQSAVALIESVAAGGRHVSLFGEAVREAWKAGHPEITLTLERGWDAALTGCGASALCGYLMEGLRPAEDGYATFRDVCGAHRDVHVH